MKPPQPRIPAVADPEVLKALARELAELGRVGLKLQDLIGLEVRAGKLGASAMMDAQAADLLVQHLHEIAKFLEAYASAILDEDANPLAAASGTLLLGGLAGRLLRPGSPPANSLVVSGEVEMF